MSLELLELILDKLTQIPEKIERIELHNGGETLLHPKLGDVLTLIGKYKSKIPGNPSLVLLTNATPLSEKKINQILGSKCVDLIRFSLDGGTVEQFELLRFPAIWSKVQQKVLAFLKANKELDSPIKTGVISVVDPSRAPNMSWMDAEFIEVLSQIDEVEIRWPHNWDGSVELSVNDDWYRTHALRSQGKVCMFLEENLVILPSGSTTFCCADLNDRGKAGMVQNMEPQDFFGSAKRQDYQELFRKDKKHEIDLCAGCTGYYRP